MMPDGAYRGAKLVLALVLFSAGIVRCPCGGWTAWVIGVVAGTTVYVLLARDAPQFRVARLAAPAAWAVLLGAAADEVLWRGWLSGPAIRPAALPHAVVASVIGFALTHLPRQGLRGVTIHVLTGSVFAAGMLFSGLLAAVAAHLSYNLWVLMARTHPHRAGDDGARHEA